MGCFIPAEDCRPLLPAEVPWGRLCGADVCCQGEAGVICTAATWG